MCRVLAIACASNASFLCRTAASSTCSDRFATPPGTPSRRLCRSFRKTVATDTTRLNLAARSSIKAQASGVLTHGYLLDDSPPLTPPLSVRSFSLSLWLCSSSRTGGAQFCCCVWASRYYFSTPSVLAAGRRLGRANAHPRQAVPLLQTIKFTVGVGEREKSCRKKSCRIHRCKNATSSSVHESGETPSLTSSRHLLSTPQISLCRPVVRLPPNAAFFEAIFW
jgi:hypothetical protein